MSDSHTEHGTTVSAAALAAQLKATQEANTRLIAQVVELEHERDELRDELRTIIRLARQRLYDAHGRDGHHTYLVILAVGNILRRDVPETPQEPPRAVDPPATCYNCGLPLVNGPIADQTAITRAGRTVSAHRVCADHLTTQGWAIVAQARGLELP